MPEPESAAAAVLPVQPPTSATSEPTPKRGRRKGREAMPAKRAKAGGGKKKQGIVKRAVGRVKRAVGIGGKRKASAPKRAPGKKKARGASRRTAPAATSGAIVLYEVPGSPNTYAVPAGRGTAKRGRGKGGSTALAPRGRGKGGKYEMLTMGLAVIGGGALGATLQSQAPVTIPIINVQVRRGPIAVVGLAAVAVATRKKYPKVARHAAALAVGVAAGAAAESALARKDASSDASPAS